MPHLGRGMTRRRSATLAAAVVCACCAVIWVGGAPARALGGGNQNANGFSASVSVIFSGDAAPGSAGSSTAQVTLPASCWWEPAEGPYNSPSDMLVYYDTVMASGVPDYVKGQYGPRSAYQAAAAAAVLGTPMQWWAAHCRNTSDYSSYTGETFTYNGIPLAVSYRAFPVVNGVVTPPAPRVDPRDLAAAAYDVMVLPLPAVDRNPKTIATGGGTLVGLPTWFWVTDPAAVGGTTGTRTIRAEVAGVPAGGAVWAQVVATTYGLQLSAPTGTTNCPPARAIAVWHPGAADSAGCTVDFPRASVAYPLGYPVTASAAWQATWTGSGGTAGVLPGLTRQAVTNVPVAEAQSIVTTAP